MTIGKSMLLTFMVAALTLSLSGCGDDEPLTPEGQSDDFIVATKVTVRLVRLTNIGTPMSETPQAEWDDPDGLGGDDPDVQLLNMTIGGRYGGSLDILDERTDPVTDFEQTVLNNKEEYQLFYSFSTNLADKITVLYTDEDVNELPVGLAFEFRVADGVAITTGTLRIALCHYTSIDKDGETQTLNKDFQIDIPVRIQ